MSGAEFNKNITAAEYEAINIVQLQNTSIKKIQRQQLLLFYEQFTIHYDQAQKLIEPKGQKVVIAGNNLYISIINSKKFLQNYANKKNIPFLGVSFGRLLGRVQFGFKTSNPDVEKYKQELLKRSEK